MFAVLDVDKPEELSGVESVLELEKLESDFEEILDAAELARVRSADLKGPIDLCGESSKPPVQQ